MKTPCFLIHKERFEKNCDDIVNSFRRHWTGKVECGYSVKTNNHEMMLQLALKKNLYAEVVSEQEYKKARECGFEDKKIIYNGPVKGETKRKACLNGAIVNIDHFDELEEIVDIILNCRSKETKIGLRVNFDLESMVPGETSTGNDVGRFGFCYENGDLEKAILFLKEKGIPLDGLHVHYTTKTRSLAVFKAIAMTINEIYEKYQLELSYLDIGGGFWGGRIMPGKPSMEEYASAVTDILVQSIKPDVTLILEPGAAMSATVVDYMTTVDSVKEIRDVRVVTVDGSYLHISPFMNKKEPTYCLQKSDRKLINKQIVCGATCLENDRLLILNNEKELKKNDEICFTNSGAYTMSFLSDFILEKPEVYLVD